MPAKPRWYPQIGDLLAKLNVMPKKQLLGRVDIEQMFLVKRTEATRIMEIVGRDKVGLATFTKVENVLAYLHSVRASSGFQGEKSRRKKLANVLATEKATAPVKAKRVVLLELPSFANLSPDIQFEDGRLVIQHQGAADLTEKLTALSQAMLHEWGRFEELVDTGNHCNQSRDSADYSAGAEVGSLG